MIELDVDVGLTSLVLTFDDCDVWVGGGAGARPSINTLQFTKLQLVLLRVYLSHYYSLTFYFT